LATVAEVSSGVIKITLGKIRCSDPPAPLSLLWRSWTRGLRADPTLAVKGGEELVRVLDLYLISSGVIKITLG